MRSIPNHQPDGIHPSRFLCGHEQYVQIHRKFSFLKQRRRQSLLVSFALLFNSDLLKVSPNSSSSFYVDCLIVFHRLYCNLRFNLFFSFLLLFSLLPFVLFSLLFSTLPPPCLPFLFPLFSPGLANILLLKSLYLSGPTAGPTGDDNWKEASLETLTARNCFKTHRSAATRREGKCPRVHSCLPLPSTSLRINISIYTRADSQSVDVYTHVKS